MPSGQVRYALPRHHVPMVTPQAEGDVIEGRIRVPLKWVRTKPHTNERLAFNQFIREQLQRWTDWRARMGWEIASTPRVRGPFTAETANAQAEQPDWAVYTVTARFRLARPASMPEEDWWHISRMANRYGVDLWATAPTVTPVAKPKMVIRDDGEPFHDPLVEGAKTLAAHGRTQKEMLIGTEDVRDPL